MTNPTQPLDLERMREVALKATRGPWENYGLGPGPGTLVRTPNPWNHYVGKMREQEDADFVTLANPASVLAVLDALSSERAARVEAEFVLSVLAACCEDHQIGAMNLNEIARCEGLDRDEWQARAQAAEAQVSALQAQVAKGRGGLGWLYVGDDGIEWSANHPVRSGEMPDARLIRRATNRELLSALKDAWEAHGEAVRSEGLLRGRWADAADRARALQAQVDHWKANHADVSRKKKEHERISKERYDALQAQVDGLTEQAYLEGYDNGFIDCADPSAEEDPDHLARLIDTVARAEGWDASKAKAELRAALSQPPADEPAKGGEG